MKDNPLRLRVNVLLDERNAEIKQLKAEKAELIEALVVLERESGKWRLPMAIDNPLRMRARATIRKARGGE